MQFEVLPVSDFFEGKSSGIKMAVRMPKLIILADDLEGATRATQILAPMQPVLSITELPD